jgi:hypothetical protein
MDDRGNCVYAESKQNPNRKSKLSYLGKALFILIIVGSSIISSIFFPPRTDVGIMFILSESILLFFTMIYLWNFFTIGNAKVYDLGIVLPETTITGKEVFVRFDQINRIVIEKLSQKKILILEKKGAVENEEVNTKDILHSISEDDIYDLAAFLNSLEGKVRIVYKNG